MHNELMKVWIKALDEDVLCPRMDCEIIVRENDIRCSILIELLLASVNGLNFCIDFSLMYLVHHTFFSSEKISSKYFPPCFADLWLLNESVVLLTHENYIMLYVDCSKEFLITAR